jgi:hypothetical protein
VLAAGSIADPRICAVELDGPCASYAATTGLSEVLKGNPLPVGQTGGHHGRTYSRLTRLANHNEVDGCNGVISDLLHEQVKTAGNERFVHSVVKVVGELHDNVASHARGVGFSAAQLYNVQGKQHIEFAIADCGCGMLFNVRRAKPGITSDKAAIEWCLVRGNTTAVAREEWDQRMPDDVAVSPLPASVRSFTTENHHVGEGLWTLTELVRLAKGALWIWSGDCQYLVDVSGKVATTVGGYVPWKGLAIEVHLDIDRAQQVGSNGLTESKLEQIAVRLGL